MSHPLRIHIIAQSETAGFSEFSWLHVHDAKVALARGIQPVLRQILGKTAALEDVLLRSMFRGAMTSSNAASHYDSSANSDWQYDEMNSEERMNSVSFDLIIAMIAQHGAEMCHNFLPINRCNPFVAQDIKESRIGKALQRLFALAYEDVPVTASEVEAIIGFLLSNRQVIAVFINTAPMEVMAHHDAPLFLETPLGIVINSAHRRAYRHEALFTLSEAANQSGVSRVLLYEAIDSRRLLPLLIGGNYMFPLSLVKRLPDILFM